MTKLAKWVKWRNLNMEIIYLCNNNLIIIKNINLWIIKCVNLLGICIGIYISCHSSFKKRDTRSPTLYSKLSGTKSLFTLVCTT
jgi:hypothetical protein